MLNKDHRKIIIHYQRSKKDYSSWSLWLWEFPQGSGKEYQFNGLDSFGITATFPLTKWSKFVTYNNLGMIIKSKGSWDEKDGHDKIIKFYKMNPDKKGNYHVYVKENDDELYANPKLDKISSFAFAKFIDFKNVQAKTNDLVNAYKITCNDEVIKEEHFVKPVNLIDTKLPNEINLDNEYVIEVELTKNNSLVHKRIGFYELYRQKHFDDLYAYNGPLGAICNENSTTFKVWSPVSKKIILRLYKSGTPKYYDAKKGNDEIILEQEMVKGEKGVFSLTIDKNLHGYYYTYVVTNDAYKNREIVDIYAKSTGINGYRGMVVDFKKIPGESLTQIKIHPYNPRSLVVYETHIADLTSSTTWSNNSEHLKLAKTFLGACLEGTTYQENGRTVKTGFDHIKELGVHAVQLLPIFDQANDENHMSYNWGYNPANYNVIEGGYSTNPFDGLVRIQEFKQLVRKYHDARINIIMDVVFNHVNGATGSNFDVLMPGYYFRYSSDYIFSNASGCGNETASELVMYRKFMIDSVLFFAQEYKIGGFRFDLMGVHDLKTMNELAKALHKYNPNIVIYGEPWSAGCSTLSSAESAAKHNADKFRGYGFFSDAMRDSLLRTNKNKNYAGWCFNTISPSIGDQQNIVAGIKGSTYETADPNKIVNYVSCHDNRTLIDRIEYNGGLTSKDTKRIAMLANAIVLTSNGISFMLSGEEFLRSKKGSDNSYNLSDEYNQLDYSLKIKNLTMFKNYQKLIYLKQNVSDLSLDKNDNLKLKIDAEKPNLITYELRDKKQKRIYKVFHANGYHGKDLLIVDLSGYELYLDTINPNKDLSSKTALIPFETLIAYKK